jgi:DNA-binding MarR family transcriptional regulator
MGRQREEEVLIRTGGCVDRDRPTGSGATLRVKGRRLKGGDDQGPASSIDGDLNLGDFVPYYVRVIANRLAQAASRTYSSKYGIGLTEWICLAVLAREQEISASRICEISGFDKGLISRSVNALEDKGFVQSKPVATHNRKRLIRFTPAGRELYLQIGELALRREEALLEGLSGQDRFALLGYLRIMQRNANNLVSGDAADPSDAAEVKTNG